MNRQDIRTINAILNIIAKDEGLCADFALALGINQDQFNEWIDNVKVD